MNTSVSRRCGLVTALLAAVALTAVACGKAATQTNTGSGMGSMSMPATTSGMAGMPSGDPMPAGEGTRASMTGYTFVPATTTLMAGMATTFTFHITGPDTKTVTAFQPDQTKLMHFYVIRSDLSGYQHLHPTMAANGTWSVSLATMTPGAYRAYASFITPDALGKPIAFVLSVPLTVPGTANTTPLPAASPTTSVDGYTLTLSGRAMSGMSSVLTLHVTRNGQPVSDLQPYLETYAHLSAFHAGNLAFAHLHPSGAVNGDHGGPDLTFNAEFPETGTWRLYVQFQTGGTLHTAAFTITTN
ncbi:MAG TPA: hypothetical protein VGD84_19560 [Pseudonocardiaceae bacterium]